MVMDQPVIRSGRDAIMYIGRQICPQFNLNDERRREMYQAVYYLLVGSDLLVSRFGMQKNKGVLMVGDIGVGKSLLMEVMHRLFKDTERRFKYVNCLQIKDMLEEGASPTEIKSWYGKDLKCDLYIDDLGIGQTVHKKFGNVTNIVAEIIFERDHLFVHENFLTHFSSNLPTSSDDKTVATIEMMYGDRCLDRLIQMTNLFEWTGKSLRGNYGLDK
jgi:DNA replication protein DnaC